MLLMNSRNVTQDPGSRTRVINRVCFCRSAFSVNLECTDTNFSILGSERGRAGGVALYLHAALPIPIVLSDTTPAPFCDALWLQVPLRGSDSLLLGVVYRSPSSPPEDDHFLIRTLGQLSSSYHFTHLLLVGDFNAPKTPWTELQCVGSSGPFAAALTEVVQQSAWTQHVVAPTRYRAGQQPSLLDLVITNERHFVDQVTINAPLGHSDHCVLTFDFICYWARNPEPQTWIRNFCRADFSGMRIFLNQVKLGPASVQGLYRTTVQKLHEADTMFVQKYSGISRKLPKRIRRFLEKKSQLFFIRLTTGDTKDELEFRKMQNCCKSEIRKWNVRKQATILNLARKNRNLVFKYMGHHRRIKSSAFSLRKRNGESTNDQTMLSEAFREHWAALYLVPPSSSHPILSRRNYERPLNNLVFTVEDMRQLLQKINPFCALWPDEVYPRILREMLFALVTHFYLVFRQSINEGNFPFAWKEAIVMPIYKTGGQLSPGSYMPISLTSVPCKMMDTKPVIDVAFRSRMLELLSSHSLDEVKSLLKVGVAAALANICSAPTPFLLFSDVFNTKPISVCQELFGFMEETITTLKDVPLFASGRNTLLRMCNDLLRRLSKSQNTVFCGQIQLFLSRLFPLDEKSGLNLMSNFNLDKETPYNKTPDPSIFKHQLSMDSSTEDPDEGETAAHPKSLEVDANLYVKFWSLQDFFKIPTSCYDKAKWVTFRSNIETVLEIFSSIKLSGSNEGDASNTSGSSKFSKYLTSEKAIIPRCSFQLLDLQLMDSSFRRYIMVQILVVFQYLITPTKFKTPDQVLSEEQTEWLNRKRELILSLLSGNRKTDSQHTDSFASTIGRILERETHWNSWKNEGCPSFVRPQEKSPVETRKRRTNPLIDRAGAKIYRFGNKNLDKLWNVCPDNLAACRDERRLFRPNLQSYFQDAILELDPAEKVDEEYKSINKEEWCWRSLRCLARRSPHFYINWNPPGKPVKAYLTTILTEKMQAEYSTEPVEYYPGLWPKNTTVRSAVIALLMNWKKIDGRCSVG
ncbi:THO complex subunit 1 [Clonorchis sinensis]|uniref:THO complex subunit 1 n=1 Tax=Clonorchis sinensis TaxID=79923 RepID=G7Y9H3_CLOSI|nr:THO complex subunit 1 [Clonorchis sinensis]